MVSCICVEASHGLAPLGRPVAWIEVQDMYVEPPFAAEDDLDFTIIPFNSFDGSDSQPPSPLKAVEANTGSPMNAGRTSSLLSIHSIQLGQSKYGRS